MCPNSNRFGGKSLLGWFPCRRGLFCRIGFLDRCFRVVCLRLLWALAVLVTGLLARNSLQPAVIRHRGCMYANRSMLAVGLFVVLTCPSFGGLLTGS
ncbi:hypothetical protein A2U01_0005353 [Trifolium medium]|uniref:Uncharacterized protein n=1 Tax=Trifolium medium TaxID=97028 RepID=A0A392MB55_9FABA|nr:hypothetical protein [Trifolium medium]